MQILLRRVARLGEDALYWLEQTGLMTSFLGLALYRACLPPYNVFPIVRQVHFIGARSTTVILVAGLFVGMVVALQFHDTLVRFGSVGLLGSAVGLSLTRELAPVLTALMVIGRAGSAMCSEIGIMRTENQIDALECMAIDPYRYLVAPKLVAGIVSVPLLTAMFVMAGILGGWFVGVVLFGVGEGAYFQGMYESVTWRDLAMGAIKSLVFGTVLVWICTARGFYLHLDRQGAFGAEGVSRVTTNAVVTSSITVLFADYLVSALLV